MNAEIEAQEYLFDVLIELWVKNFEGQRANTSTLLSADVSIQWNSVSKLKVSLWYHIASKFKGKLIEHTVVIKY